MVKARQRNVRSFIFLEGNTEETLRYVEKNAVLLQNFLLIFTYGMEENLKALLKEKNLHFVENYLPKVQNLQSELSPLQEQNTNNQTIKEIPLQSTQDTQKSQEIKTLIFHRNIRSGEEIISEGDITIFGRINSGALIQSEGNVQIYGEIDGNVFCNGEYMILGEILQGNILFSGEIIDKDKLKKGYKKFYKKQDEIIIEDLL